MKTVAVIGEGAWGTAIAMLLADNGMQVKLWCQDPEVAASIVRERLNVRYFPDVVVPQSIEPVTDLEQALEGVTYIFEAIPMVYLRIVLERMKPYVRSGHVMIVLSKGIERDTLLFPVQLIKEVFNNNVSCAVLAGPSFAQELAQRRITAVALAALPEHIQVLESILNNDYFRVDPTHDVIGVQVCAALKNLMALGLGMADGAGLTDNTIAFLLTRGLQEMATIAQALGGEQQTAYGLAGVGDLVLSCGRLGRNATIGRMLGQGMNLGAIEQQIPVLPEGINTAAALYKLTTKEQLDVPFCRGVYEIMAGKATMHDVVKRMLK